MSLIDEFLPHYQFVERHATLVRADPARIFDIVLTRDVLREDSFVRAMLTLRALPSALWQRIRATQRPTITTFGMQNFTSLGRDGNREILYGLIGRFWRLDGGLHVLVQQDPIAQVEEFRSFTAPGFAKLVFNLSCEPGGSEATRLSTETRVSCPDFRTRMLFAPYWYAIRLGSGFIRRRLLRAVKLAAEKA